MAAGRHAGLTWCGVATPRPITYRRHIMKWETPTAADFRFGFEITMYIASR